MKNRRFNRQVARASGLFWLPCPLCGQKFGGHEWRDIGELSSTYWKPGENTGQGICPDCTLAGRGNWPTYSLESDEDE